MIISVYAVFAPGSGMFSPAKISEIENVKTKLFKEYFLYTGDSCPVTEESVSVEPRNDTFWISCPKNEDEVPLYAEPDTYLSVALVFTSAVCQRWGVYMFDMVVTQLFQISIPQSKRNRAAAGQYR